MKLTVVEAGIRPFVALVQYNVVNGKSGRKTRTPLNVMVHNNRPMQLAVDVRGGRLTTWIDGEEVDSFIDSTLASGGERAVDERIHFLAVDPGGQAAAADIHGQLHGPVIVHHHIERRPRLASGLAVYHVVLHQGDKRADGRGARASV